jgi:hypothetical protein
VYPVFRNRYSRLNLFFFWMSKIQILAIMKKVIVLVLMTVLLTAVESFSQSTPVVDGRQHAQRTRIRSGVTSGELTRAETAKLRAEQRHIRRAERRAKADGAVTGQEKARLSRKQNRASRDITRQKHD